MQKDIRKFREKYKKFHKQFSRILCGRLKVKLTYICEQSYKAKFLLLTPEEKRLIDEHIRQTNEAQVRFRNQQNQKKSNGLSL